MLKRLAAAALVLGLAFTPAAADAHVVRVHHGNDIARVGAAHNRAVVKDRECDGNSVFVEISYRTKEGTRWFKRWSDANGCGTGGTVKRVPNTALDIRLCEVASSETCTDWRRI